VLKIPQNDKLAAAFRDEAMMLITLSRQPHASIVRFVSFVDYGTRLPFLVMDFVEGEPLEHRIASAPLADDAFHAIGRDIASGLAFSHERGIAHYDVKPANIMLRADGGRAVLVDWGLAGSVVAIGGTPEYMAPERFDASGERLREAVVGASDVFALGCVLAGMRTGRELVSPAFTRDETTANPNLTAFAACAPDVARWYTCATIVASPEMLMRRAEPSLAVLPRAIAEIVARCLAKEPGARPSAREVADALSR
jgi:serine/threonine-protein kinase